jgi:phosphate transport system substrate-binding protein
MLRSLARRGSIVLAALTLPVLLLGNTATATVPARAKLASATLDGSGATFPYGYYQVAIGGFEQQQKSVTINYQPVGSGTGRTDFAEGTTDFGASDAPYEDSDPQPPDEFLYFPTVVAPITVSYNVEDVKGLKLSADTIAKIFSGAITRWDDDAIASENPKAELPSTTITVARRSDSSGTTANFTSFLSKAAPDSWKLGTGSTVSWPEGIQGGSGNSGVAKLVQSTDGAIGYVDYSDAKASKLTFAAVQNASGKYVMPSIASASAAADGATVDADLTFDPIDASGAKAYPITSPTWLMVMADQTDAAKGAAIEGFLTYVYGEGQELAEAVDYAPLPKRLLGQAKAQVEKITVPSAS